MFVEIVNPASSVSADVYIKQSRVAGFTKWHAFNVLKQTSHYGNIKFILKIINGYSPEKQKEFKHVILAMVDGRENSAINYATLQDIALRGGYFQEFLEADKKDKIYDCSEINCFKAKSVNDVVGDLASKYNMLDCDFEGSFEIKLWCNLPRICNFSRCDEVDLRQMDLGDIKFMKFKEGANVDLGFVKKLPKLLDVSYVGEICLDSCDLANLKELKFRKDARVDLDDAYNFPCNVDFTPCSYIYLRGADLANLTSMSFGKDAVVKMEEALNLPKYIDVSRCKKVKLEKADVSKVEKIIFRDEEQMNKSLIDMDAFKGKIIFAGEKLKSEQGMVK